MWFGKIFYHYNSFQETDLRSLILKIWRGFYFSLLEREEMPRFSKQLALEIGETSPNPRAVDKWSTD